jgi:ELWxxDGT repeat protein
MSYVRMQWTIPLFAATFFVLSPGPAFSAEEPLLIPMYHLLLGKSVTTIELVKEIDPGEMDAGPEDLYKWNGLLLFGTNDGVHGNEIWKSDGTEVGTVMVKDIHEGTGSSDGYGHIGWDRDFTAMGGFVYFAATSSDQPASLWKTDGTEAGTSWVKDVSPANMIVFNGALYFTGYTGSGISSDTELWTSDGTEDGTYMVKNISDREEEGGPSYAGSESGFVVLGNAFYFRAANTDGNTPPEPCGLWKSDGTEAGTVAVKPGTEIDPSGEFAVCGGSIYFAHFVGSENYELWKSDGSADGTVRIDGIGFTNSPGRYTEYNGSLYFRADDGTSGNELWKLDCVTDAATMVKDINPGPTSSYVEYLTVLNNVLYFTAEDDAAGDELWKTDGTAAGTTRVKDINPGPDGSSISALTAFQGMLYFSADDGEHGDELWQSDGTEAGTTLLMDINPGPDWSYPYDFTAVNGSLFFATATPPTTAWQLWRLRR